MSRPVYPQEWGVQLEVDYEEYMDRLYENVDAEDYDDALVDASGEPFCGCSVCERRASWTFLMVKFLEAARDGVITLEEDSPGHRLTFVVWSLVVNGNSDYGATGDMRLPPVTREMLVHATRVVFGSAFSVEDAKLLVEALGIPWDVLEEARSGHGRELGFL